MKNINNKIENLNAVISVIGLGYVGLPLSIRFAEVGYQTIGLDIDDEKIKILRNNKSYINHINSKKIYEINKKGFVVTSDFKQISKSDVIIICVPTPLGIHREPDLSYIINDSKIKNRPRRDSNAR